MELAGWLRIWLRLSSSAKVPLGAIGDGSWTSQASPSEPSGLRRAKPSFSRFAFLRLASLE